MSGEASLVPGASYRVGYECVAGALHERRGSPGQDAGYCLQPCPGGLPVLLALSDGHGSAQYFRSDRGAQTAVEVAVEIGEELAMSDITDLSTIRREAQERLPQRIAQRWRERISRHLEEQPFTDEERAQLMAAKGARAVETLERDPHSAYGATLLLVIVTSQFLLFAQLGDGDILRVDRDGVTSPAFPAPADSVGEDTASLCMDGAWREFQVQVFPLQNGPPPLILASTDGYSKSFKSDADFLRIGSDYLELFRSQGVEAVQARLRGYLMQATREGCGDDVTLGFVRCSEPEDFDFGALGDQP